MSVHMRVKQKIERCLAAAKAGKKILWFTQCGLPDAETHTTIFVEEVTCPECLIKMKARA